MAEECVECRGTKQCPNHTPTWTEEIKDESGKVIAYQTHSCGVCEGTNVCPYCSG